MLVNFCWSATVTSSTSFWGMGWRLRNEDLLLTTMSHLPIYLMSEWKSQVGEYLTRDHDREPNIFLSLILCENIIKQLFYYTFLKTICQRRHFSLSLQKFESTSRTRGKLGRLRTQHDDQYSLQILCYHVNFTRLCILTEFSPTN